ncbi:hypothetical protein Tco_0511484 [Tanacetum coccineum]
MRAHGCRHRWLSLQSSVPNGRRVWQRGTYLSGLGVVCTTPSVSNPLPPPDPPLDQNRVHSLVIGLRVKHQRRGWSSIGASSSEGDGGATGCMGSPSNLVYMTRGTLLHQISPSSAPQRLLPGSAVVHQRQDTSSISGNDAHVDDANIRPIYDEEPMAEVQTTAEINVFATGQQHTEQPEFNNEEEVDQNAKQCHDTCPLHVKLTDNQITELSNQSLES